jgi:hypothetical protein
MRRKQSYLILTATGAVLGLGAINSAFGQTCTLSIKQSGGGWTAYAQLDSGTDNAGLATFAIDVIGSGGETVTGSFNVNPTGSITLGKKTETTGWQEFPSNGKGGGSYITKSSAPATPGNGIGISAGQNVTYGSGNSASLDEEVVQGYALVASTASSNSGGLNWTVPTPIAQGTYSGTGGTLTVGLDLSIGQGIQSLNQVSAGKWVGPGNLTFDTVIPGSTGSTTTTTTNKVAAFNLQGSTSVGTILGGPVTETGHEPYNLITLTESSPVVTGSFDYSGFAQGDTVDVLLKLGSTTGGDPAPADLANIIAYINSNDGTEGAIASAIPASLAALYPGYDLLLSDTAGANDPWADLDFSGFGDTSIPTGTLGITGVGVVPEPASLSLLALGGIGLVSRRRRKDSAK